MGKWLNGTGSGRRSYQGLFSDHSVKPGYNLISSFGGWTLEVSGLKVPRI
jgi:hypothetical protein